MNELMELSTDIKQIELEIKHHKNIAGQSIWEIGRRLNHVKKNDLVHGEFINWVEEKVGMTRQSANRMMRVSEELPNDTTLLHLGESALYLIASMPEEERTKEHTLDTGAVKQVEEMTVRELQEVKRKLSQKEAELQQLKNLPPQIIEKEVVKEVIPENIKDKLIKLEEDKLELNRLKEAGMSVEEYDRQRKDVDKKLKETYKEYNDLTATMERLRDSYNKTNENLTNQATLLHEVRRAVKPIKQHSSEIMQLIKTTGEVDLITAKSINVELETAYEILNEINKQLNTLKAEVIYYEQHD